jgi:hypothetical protein
MSSSLLYLPCASPLSRSDMNATQFLPCPLVSKQGRTQPSRSCIHPMNTEPPKMRHSTLVLMLHMRRRVDSPIRCRASMWRSSLQSRQPLRRVQSLQRELLLARGPPKKDAKKPISGLSGGAIAGMVIGSVAAVPTGAILLFGYRGLLQKYRLMR